MSDAAEETRYDLPDWSDLTAEGPDAGRFLHSFCTNDVLRLSVGDACEAFFTDVKARVVAYGWVFRADGELFRVILSSPRAEELRNHLDRYLIREKVTLSAAAPRGYALLLGDPRAGVPVVAFGANARLEPLDAIAAGPAGAAAAFEALRIARRVPLDRIDVDERNLPQEVDRNESAISFTKGCYLGQEPVARIDALGRVNWLLRTVAVDGPPPAAGAALLAGESPVGRVTSSVATARGALALAYMRREHAAMATRLVVDGCAAEVLAR